MMHLKFELKVRAAWKVLHDNSYWGNKILLCGVRTQCIDSLQWLSVFAKVLEDEWGEQLGGGQMTDTLSTANNQHCATAHIRSGFNCNSQIVRHIIWVACVARREGLHWRIYREVCYNFYNCYIGNYILYYIIWWWKVIIFGKSPCDGKSLLIFNIRDMMRYHHLMWFHH